MYVEGIHCSCNRTFACDYAAACGVVRAVLDQSRTLALGGHRSCDSAACTYHDGMIPDGILSSCMMNFSCSYAAAF